MGERPLSRRNECLTRLVKWKEMQITRSATHLTLTTFLFGSQELQHVPLHMAPRLCYPDPMRSTADRAKAAWAQRPRLDPEQEARFEAGLEEAEKFFRGESKVQRAL